MRYPKTLPVLLGTILLSVTGSFSIHAVEDELVSEITEVFDTDIVLAELPQEEMPNEDICDDFLDDSEADFDYDGNIHVNQPGTPNGNTEGNPENGILNGENQNEQQESFTVIDVDPGNYQVEMFTGEYQMLTPMAMYVRSDVYKEKSELYYNSIHEGFGNTAEDEYKEFLQWLLKPEQKVQVRYEDLRTSARFYTVYSSDTPSVVSVNAIGRMTAVSSGTAVISIKCEDYIKSLEIVVREKNQGETGSEQSMSVIDIDPGDYKMSMEVGSTQLLKPTAIYEDLTTSEKSVYTYSSSDETVLTVNALGRIYAVAEGSAEVTIRCKDYKKTIMFLVSGGELPQDQNGYSDIGGMGDIGGGSSGYYSEGSSSVAVKDLDFGDYETKLEVGKTMPLSVSVIPSNATNSTITYYSSNEKIATVNGNGRVKGISSGKVDIIAKAGGVKKAITLEVEVKTKSISIEETYVILKPGEELQIKATVTPEDAPQSLTYTPADEKIVTVSETGVIKAVSKGNTSIVVSNGSIKTVISVIVNENEQMKNEEEQKTVDMETGEKKESSLLNEIKEADSDKTISVYSGDLKTVTSDILRELYGTEKKLMVIGDGYHLTLCGNDIKNVENELDTEIIFREEEENLNFTLNNGKKLPGKIRLGMDGTEHAYKWIYLYNVPLKKWQLLNTYQDGMFAMDETGEYCLRQKKLTKFALNWWFIAGGAAVLLAGTGVFIGMKKKYWFW